MLHTQSKIKWLEEILADRLIDGIKIHSSKNSLFISIDKTNKNIEIESNSVLYQSNASKVPCSNWNYDCNIWANLINNSLPAPGCANLDFPVIDKTDSGYKIKYDILGLIYWMLSRQEETGRVDLDQYGRFPATSSHAFKYGYLERPIVDEWIDILKQVMKKVWPAAKIKAHQFQMQISHDVDIPSRYIFQNTSGLLYRMAGDILKRGDVYSALSALWGHLKVYEELPKNDSLNTFDWIMDQSEQYDLKSAFYFICGKTHSKTDADYDVDHPAIRSLMRKIYKREHEIGLHPSYNACCIPGAIVNELGRLHEICNEEGIRQREWGGRMHYLRWMHPSTMCDLEEAGMDYDSTLSYADHAGFRCGTCYEYPAFDPISDRRLNLRIRPLIAMDVTVSGYMGLGFGDASYNKFTELKNACRSVNGTFTLLWHNNQLVTKQAKKLYSSLLE